MNREKLLTTLAWIIGIISSLVFYRYLNEAINSLGVLTIIDYGEEVCRTGGAGQTSWVDCDTEGHTDVATGITLLSITLGVAIGSMILNRSFIPFSKNEAGMHSFFTWSVCLVLWLSLSVLVQAVVGFEIGKWITLILAIGIGYCGWQFNEPRVSLLRAKQREIEREIRLEEKLREQRSYDEE